MKCNWFHQCILLTFMVMWGLPAPLCLSQEKADEEDSQIESLLASLNGLGNDAVIDNTSYERIVQELEMFLERLNSSTSMMITNDVVVVDGLYYQDRKHLLQILQGLGQSYQRTGQSSKALDTLDLYLRSSFNINKLILRAYPIQVLRVFTVWLTAFLDIANKEKNLEEKKEKYRESLRLCYEAPLERFHKEWSEIITVEFSYYLELVAYAYEKIENYVGSVNVHEILCRLDSESKVYRGSLLRNLGNIDDASVELIERYISDEFYIHGDLFDIYIPTVRKIYQKLFFLYYEQDDFQNAVEKGYELPLALFGNNWYEKIWENDRSYFEAVIESYEKLDEVEKAQFIRDRLNRETTTS